MSDETELLPCPFCGGSAFISTEYATGERCITCHVCRASVWGVTEWNTRTVTQPPRTLDNLVIVESNPTLTSALERILEVAKAGAVQTKDQDAAERFAWIMGRARGQLLRYHATPITTQPPLSVAIEKVKAMQDALLAREKAHCDGHGTS